MGLEETIHEFNQFCNKLELVIDSFINTYDNLEEKYNDILKKLWSAKSEINLMQSNLQEMKKNKEKNKILFDSCKEIIERIDKIEEMVKSLEIEFLNE
ncbi:MAG TPA: hypothetical protein PLA12_10835 [Candidatus Hydrogenedens sp.]|nr:hypothetical protein [Candidatus Hydrogenedens sp.]